jgi:hypothetical protein
MGYWESAECLFGFAVGMVVSGRAASFFFTLSSASGCGEGLMDDGLIFVLAVVVVVIVLFLIPPDSPGRFELLITPTPRCMLMHFIFALRI